MTNKEIRTLPLPKVTSEVRILALQKSSRKAVVITAQKIKGFVCINVFVEIEDEVKLAYRYFYNGKEQFLYNLLKNKINNGFLTNSLYASIYPFDFVCTEKTANKIVKLVDFKYEYQNIRSVIAYMESNITSSRAIEKKSKQKAQVDELMKTVKATPKSLNKTIQKMKTTSSYIFFNRKDKKANCSCCGTEFKINELPAFKEKETGKCPYCKKEAIFRSENRRKNTRDARMVVLVQANGKHRLVQRYFHVLYDHSNPTNNMPDIIVKELIREFIDYDKRTCDTYERYTWKTLNVGGWCPPQKSFYNPSGLHYDFLDGEVHKIGLEKELKKAEVFNRFEGKELIDSLAGYDKMKVCYADLIYYDSLAFLPFIEFLTKCGLTKLVLYYLKDNWRCDYGAVNKYATNIINCIKLKNRKQLKECIELNISHQELEYIQKHNDVSKTERSVKEIIRIGNEFSCGRLNQVFALTDSRLGKIRKYFNSIKDYPREHISVDYFDYLSDCEKLEYDMTSNIVLYPKDFKRAHDEAATNIKCKKFEADYEKIEKLLPAMHELFDYHDENFIIKAPDHGKDITYEGQAMNHCVGGYVSRVAAGETVILFIRKITEPEKPFVTMEVKGGKIIQTRAYNNKKPSAEVFNFVEKWKKLKNVA